MPDRLTKEHRKFALEHQLLHEIVKKTKDANEVKLLFHLLDIQCRVRSINKGYKQRTDWILEVKSVREKETHIFGDRLRSDLSTLPKIHISQNFEYSSINTTVLSFFVCGLETTLWSFLHPSNSLGKPLDLQWVN